MPLRGFGPTTSIMTPPRCGVGTRWRWQSRDLARPQRQIHSVVCVTDGNDNSNRDGPTSHQCRRHRQGAGLLHRFRPGHQYDEPARNRLGKRGNCQLERAGRGDLAGEFAEISDLFTVLYRLRWVTPKQGGDPAFVPSFWIAYEGSSASNNLVTVFIDTNSTPPTTNYVTNFASYLPYTPSNYAGNVNIGLLDLQPNSALPSGASLYANYLPEYIRQFNLHYRLNWPGTVLPATNQGACSPGGAPCPPTTGRTGHGSC